MENKSEKQTCREKTKVRNKMMENTLERERQAGHEHKVTGAV